MGEAAKIGEMPYLKKIFTRKDGSIKGVKFTAGKQMIDVIATESFPDTPDGLEIGYKENSRKKHVDEIIALGVIPPTELENVAGAIEGKLREGMTAREILEELQKAEDYQNEKRHESAYEFLDALAKQKPK
jgi:hypothetical protein